MSFSFDDLHHAWLDDDTKRAAENIPYMKMVKNIAVGFGRQLAEDESKSRPEDRLHPRLIREMMLSTMATDMQKRIETEEEMRIGFLYLGLAVAVDFAHDAFRARQTELIAEAQNGDEPN